MTDPAIAIAHTRKWITEVVIGFNFCPFAARPVKHDAVHYSTSTSGTIHTALADLHTECRRLDNDPGIETSFLIFPYTFISFDEYLALLDQADAWLRRERYEGIYQVASFHPQYRFAGTGADDAANYTNRSPYPMLHLLREDSVEKALKSYPHPDGIPERNIRFAREKGVLFMKDILARLMK